MKTLKLHAHSQFRQVLAGMFLAFLTTLVVSGQVRATDVRELKLGKKLEREIKRGEAHEYKLALRSQQVLFVELEEQSFDVKVELVKASDNRSVATANVGGGFERESLIFVAEESGDYLLRIDAAETQFGNGSYRFSARLAEAPTEKDKTRIEALRLLSEAVTLHKENTAVDIRKAIAEREQALVLWQKIGDTYWEGRTLDRLGAAHKTVLENNKAVDCLQRALQIVKESDDKPLEAATLNTIGLMMNGFGEYQQAIEYHNQALQIFSLAKNNVGIINSLNFLGNSYVGLKDYPKANDYYKKSLAIAQKEKDQNLEASCLFLFGTVLDAQNEKPKALEQYNQSLALWREIRNNGGIALALLKIGTIQSSQGAADEALKSLDEALKLFHSEKNRWQEVAIFNVTYPIYYRSGKINETIDCLKNSLAVYQEFKVSVLEIPIAGLIANLYNGQGNTKEAIKYAEMALATDETVIERTVESSRRKYEIGMRESKATTMTTLGSVYLNSRDFEKALQYFKQALAVFENQEEPDSKLSTLYALDQIGEIYKYQYEWDKALDTNNRVLSLARELKNDFAIAMTLNTIGLIHSSISDERKALDYFERALEVIRLIPNRGDVEKRHEAAMLDNIGSSYLSLGEPKKALEYHNQALVIRQETKDPRFIDGQATTFEALARTYSFLGDNKQALDLLNKALDVYRQAPQHVKDLARNRDTELKLINDIGVIYRNTGDFGKALEYSNQALNMAVEKDSLVAEASALNNISLVNLAFGEPQKALHNLNRAMELNKKIGDKSSQPIYLGNIAQVYSYWGSQQEVIDYTNQALKIAEEVGNKETIATCLSNIGIAYAALGENDKAFDYYNRSLKISHEIENKSGEAISLNNLALSYSTIGERGKALDSYEKALSIIRSVGDKSGEATIIGNMGYDNAELGQYQKALEDCEQSLKISREIGDKSGEMSELNQIGRIYRTLGEQKKDPENFKRALLNYEQTLKLSRDAESKISEAGALLGMGQVYVETNETSKALPILNEALNYSKKYQNRSFEDASHLALGKLHEKDGAFDKAIEEYQQSLIVARAITDKDIEAKALKGLMSAWRARGNVQLAIFYGKQAVNKYQELRGSIRNLKRETQDVYRDKVTDTYRELADLLIAVGRLRDAEQVLAMLKEQEAFEFVRRDAGEAEDLLSKNVGLEPKEQKALAEYIRLSDELTAKSQRLDALSLKPDQSQSEKDEYQKLKQEVDDAKEGVLVFFKKLDSEFTKRIEDGETITPQSIDSLRAKLREAGPGVVLISTYLLPQRYRVIVSTGRTMVDRKTEYQPLKLDGEQVNKKIEAFRQALQNPKLDPRPLGKELYDIFFKPIERDIENAKAKTLLWSLDGSLRYIPVGALYDGKQYLAERYQNVFMTLGRTADLFDEPSRRDWHVLGLGVSKQYKNFSELPSVPFELRTIVRDERDAQDNEGMLSGIRLLDSAFTEQSFIDNLRPAHNFNVVHLATHFHLGSNLDSSWLLLGDGNLLSLYTINKDSDFDFKNIDLLTLSACETGVTIGNRNGGEVESLGIIAQKNGAKAVLATLWKVADKSTSLLMSEFYRLRKENPKTTKAAALQLAQREMISGNLNAPESMSVRRDTGEASADASPDFTHPYYWSPFILIGNWH